MKRIKKRALSWVLAAMMVLGVIPSMAVEAYGATNKAYHIDILVKGAYQNDMTFSLEEGAEAKHATIDIEKKWNVAGAVAEDEVTVTVKGVTNAGGETENVVSREQVNLTAADNWKASLTGKPSATEDGKEITYIIEEDVSGDYYEVIKTDVSTNIDQSINENVLVYTEDNKTITFYFNDTPHININGTDYPYSTSTWQEQADGKYVLNFTYTKNNRTYKSAWTYDKDKKEYHYASEDYMYVTDIKQVTYTKTDETVATIPGNIYTEQTDTNRADQEFFMQSSGQWNRQRDKDMQNGTKITVSYKYTYGYFDKFGEWHSREGLENIQEFDTGSGDFKNHCGEANDNGTRRGFDVMIHLDGSETYRGDGVIDLYDVDITNTPISSLSLIKTVVNEDESPLTNEQKEEEFTFTVMLAEFLGVMINDTFDLIKTAADGTETKAAIAFKDGNANIALKTGETAKIEGLPYGIGYKITENTPENYTVESGSAEGTVNDSNAVFKNVYTPPIEHGDLIIKKVVKHPYGEGYMIPSKSFDMVVTLMNGNEPAANQTYTAVYNGDEEDEEDGTSNEVTTDENGQFEIRLEHGQEIKISGIEKGITAKVTEAEVTGYTAGYEPSDSVEITAGEEAVIGVINTLNKPDPVEVKIDLKGEKTLKDPEGEVIPAADWGDLSFDIVLQKYVYNENRNTWEWQNTEETETVNKDSNIIDFVEGGKILKFDAVGTYNYQVVEANHGQTLNGIVYDNVMHTFSVIVTDEDMDGVLEAKVVRTHGEEQTSFNTKKEEDGTVVWYNHDINFTNTKNAGETTETVMIRKLIDNNSDSTRVNSAGYKFNLYETDSDYETEGSTPTSTEATDGTGETYFTLDYKYAEGEGSETHYYVLKEAASGITGMLDSDAEYRFEVTVEYKQDGTISSEITNVSVINGSNREIWDAGGYVEESGTFGLVTFENVYDPEDVAVAIPITKNLNENNYQGSFFSFDIYRVKDYVEGEPVVDEEVMATVTGGEDRPFKFEKTYSKVGAYYYKLVERIPQGATEDNNYTAKGITYDTAEYYVRIDVTDDNGVLKAEYDVLNSTAIVFNNRYEPEAAKVSFEAHKTMEDETAVKEYYLQESMFSFTIKQVDEEGNALAGGYTETATLDVDEDNSFTGKAVFSEIKFEQTGEYYYKIIEEENGLTGVTYDNTIHEYKVVVTDDMQEGKLKAEIYEKIDGQYESQGTDYEAGFNNIYDAAAVELPISGKKVLVDSNTEQQVALEGGEFKFVLREMELGEDNETWVMKDSGQVLYAENDNEGIFEFSPIRYVEEGIYRYVVYEDSENPADSNIEYDETRHYLYVEVKDNAKGALAAFPRVTKEAADDPKPSMIESSGITFKNIIYLPNIEIAKAQAVNDGKATTDTQAVAAGDKVTYYMIVSNSGGGTATNVVVKDEIPEGLILAEDSIKINGDAAGDAATVKDGEITWHIGDIEGTTVPEEPTRVLVSFTVTVPKTEEDTSWTNIAVVDYENDPEDPEGDKGPEESNPVDITESPIKEPLKDKLINNLTGDGTKTGDDFNLVLAVAVGLLALIAAAVVILAGRRKRKK